MLNKSLHLVEPTLTGLSGHEYAHVSGLIAANNSFDFDVHIWLDKQASNQKVISKLNLKSANIHKYFIRTIRQFQKIFLYYKFLKNNQIFYVCTSGIIDLIFCYWVVKLFKLSSKTAFFHFHQFNTTINKITKLKKIADYINNLDNQFKIFTTTNKLAQIFIECGFKNVKQIAYPNCAPQNIIEKLQYDFNKVLYAGVARFDKGFSLVVDTIAIMQQEYKKLPFAVQVAAPSSNKYDAKTLLSLIKLQQIAALNNNIILYKQALTTQEYQALFCGAICLLVYDKQQYANKFSGVTLDAFYAGCPVITVSDTWMGEVTSKFDAGIVLFEVNVITVRDAILKIKEQYTFYHNNAKLAAKYLITTHDPKHSLQAVYDCL